MTVTSGFNYLWIFFYTPLILRFTANALPLSSYNQNRQRQHQPANPFFGGFGGGSSGPLGGLLRLGDLVKLGSIDTNSVVEPDFSLDKIHGLCRLLEYKTAAARIRESVNSVKTDPSNTENYLGLVSDAAGLSSKCNILKMFGGINLSDPSNIGGFLEGLATAGNSGPAAPVTRFLTGPGIRPSNANTGGIGHISSLGGAKGLLSTLAALGTGGSRNQQASSLSSFNNPYGAYGTRDLNSLRKLNSLNYIPPSAAPSIGRGGLGDLLSGNNFGGLVNRLNTPGLGFANNNKADDLGSFFLKNFLPSPAALANGADIIAPAQEAGTSFVTSFLRGLFQG